MSSDTVIKVRMSDISSLARQMGETTKTNTVVIVVLSLTATALLGLVIWLSISNNRKFMEADYVSDEDENAVNGDGDWRTGLETEMSSISGMDGKANESTALDDTPCEVSKEVK